MKKIMIVAIILALIILAVISIRFFGSAEDSWICQDGEWVKHGNPSAPKPVTSCPEKKQRDGQTSMPDDQKDKNVVGGDRDEHDCIGSAGYQWCPSTKKCQKMWEEYCQEFKDQFRVTDFNSCVAQGNPIGESYPRKCKTADGQNFTEDLGNAVGKSNLIRLDSPKPNEKIKSPLIISGEAKGEWFFEGSFPVSLTDWDGLIIAEGNATAQGDWMKEDFVPFRLELTFKKPELYNRGSLILQKSNPSDLPQNDDALEVPILYADE